MSLREPSYSACLVAQKDIDRAIEERMEGRSLCASDDAIRTLRRQRNVFAPVNARLPPELLAKIFQSLQDRVVQEAQRHLVRKQTRWIRVLNVCQLWRRIALHFPSLWARIAFMNHEMASMMLERSSSAPLVVHYRKSRQPGHITPITLIGQAMSRAKEMNFFEDIPFLMELMPYVSKPAPLLEDFKLRASLHSGTSSVLPGDLFAGDAPRLRTVHLTGIYVWPTPSVFENVTDLSLKCFSVMPRYTSRKLLELLQPMQGLRRLSLESTVMPNDARYPLLRDDNVTFPHLRHITIHDLTPACIRLTRHIVPDPSAQLFVICSAREPEHCAIAEALPARYRAPTSGLQPIRYLSVSVQTFEIIVCGATEGEKGCVPPHKCAFYLMFHPSRALADLEGNGDVSLRNMLEKVRLDSVRVLNIDRLRWAGREASRTLSPFREDASLGARARIELEHASSLEEIVRLFGRLSNVQELHLHRESALLPILQILYPPTGERPAFELLRRLHIEANLSTHGIACLISPYLAGRAGTGLVVELEKLTINGHVVPMHYIQDLSTLETWHPA